jgi:hypothetical protein
MTTSADTWLQQFSKRQQMFLGPDLNRAVRYLENARKPKEAWGPYPKLDCTLYHSCLAIEALYNSCDSRTTGIIADAALYMRRENQAHIKDLNIEDLTSLLLIARCEKHPDEEYRSIILDKLSEAYRLLENTKDRVSVRTVCCTLLAVAKNDKSTAQWLQGWTNWLLNIQRPEDGSWPIISGEPGSIIATALAVRALAHLNEAQTKAAMRRGIEYLESSLGAEDKPNLGSRRDTFTQAIVLRSLAESSVQSYRYIQEGINELVNKINSDGGWGGGPQEPSSVEHTALCLLALVAAGETRFVPAHLAEAALSETLQISGQIRNELDRLKQDFDQQIQVHCGKVVEELDKLRQENGNLKRQAQLDIEKLTLTRRIQKLSPKEYVREIKTLDYGNRGIFSRITEAFRYSVHPSRFYPVLAAVIAVITLAILLVSWNVEPTNKSLPVILGGILGAILSMIPFFFFKRFYGSKFSTEMQSTLLPYTFIALTESISLDNRENLIKSLSRILSFTGKQENTKRILKEIDIPVKMKRELEPWLEYVRNLDERGRQVLFKQLAQISALPSITEFGPDTKLSSELSTLRYAFLDITDDLSPRLREEIVYRLFTDLVDLPADIGRRYAQDLIVRFKIVPRTRREVLSWIDEALRLSPSDRRILFDQIRRTILH